MPLTACPTAERVHADVDFSTPKTCSRWLPSLSLDDLRFFRATGLSRYKILPSRSARSCTTRPLRRQNAVPKTAEPSKQYCQPSRQCPAALIFSTSFSGRVEVLMVSQFLTVRFWPILLKKSAGNFFASFRCTKLVESRPRQNTWRIHTDKGSHRCNHRFP